MSSLKIKTFLETKIFFVFTLFFFLIFPVISYFTKWTKTEVFPTHSSKYLFSLFEHEFLFSLKPIFYVLLKISFLLSEILPVTPMTLARFLFALNGLILVSFMYLYLQKKTNKYNAILAVLLITSSYIFLDRGFRIRSDLLCTSVSLFIIYFIHTQNKKSALVILMALSSLFFITPKGIYWIVLSLLLLQSDLQKLKLSLGTNQIKFLVLFLILFWTAISYMLSDPFFIKSITESIKYYVINLKMSYPFIWNEHKNMSLPIFTSLFIKKNHFIILLIFCKFLFTFYHFVKFKKLKKQDFFFIILLFITFFHPGGKLFFFASLEPFFIIAFFTDPLWLHAVNKRYSKVFKNLLLIFFLGHAFFYITHFTYRIVKKDNNKIQKNILSHLNNFYEKTNPSLNILDPSCLIYSRKTQCKYLLYQKFNQKKFLANNSFDIILSSMSLKILTILLTKRNSFEYVNIKNHIFYKGLIIDLKKEKDLYKVSSKTTSKSDFLSGHKVLKELFKKTNQDLLEGFYFYIYVDKWNHFLETQRENFKKSEFPLLLDFKSYSEKEWKQALIPVQHERLAVFYAPFPFDLKEKKSLRVLLKYDMW
ncbi:MAG: hypothetical protein GDA46_02210 [Bdellovibrionales bacterium]|nr:hypothetical protein [Bdellovibrionales bacterium]